MSHTETALLRVRLGTDDTHYSDHLIPGATIVRLFADCATEIMLREDGTGGLLAGIESAAFHKAVRVGDYLEIVGKVIHRGTRSRKYSVEARRTIERLEPTDPRRTARGLLSECVVHDPPELVGEAILIAVVPRDHAAARGGV